jgi:hypothetical protein
MLNEKIHTSQGILLICANHYRFGGLAGRFAVRHSQSERTELSIISSDPSLTLLVGSVLI